MVRSYPIWLLAIAMEVLALCRAGYSNGIFIAVNPLGTSRQSDLRHQVPLAFRRHYSAAGFPGMIRNC